jgi:Mg2+ and Co2+ transporter CorA
VNVAGIPGTEHPGAFVAVCFMLFGLALLQLWVFKRQGWV